MNLHAIAAIYVYEMRRFRRTIFESLLSPVISTTLYFVVFGAAIGERIEEVEGISYGAFIVPGLIMLSVMTQAISNASFGIYFPKFIGTIYELLSAPQLRQFAADFSGFRLAQVNKTRRFVSRSGRFRGIVVVARGVILFH